MTPPDRICASCGRAFAWRKAWARDWDQVRYCSGACRKRGVTATDTALETAILHLLAERPGGATICPSEAARAVNGEARRRADAGGGRGAAEVVVSAELRA